VVWKGVIVSATVIVRGTKKPIAAQEGPAVSVIPRNIITGRCILLVDNDIRSREFMEDVLGLEEALVLTASSAKEALLLIEGVIDLT